MFRGRNEGILQLSLNADPDAEEGSRQSYCEEIIRDYLDVRFTGQPADKWREQVIYMDMENQSVVAFRNGINGKFT